MYFESHAHYDDEQFNGDRESIINDLFAHKVYYVINVGASMASTKASVEIANKYDFIYAAVGIHPSETGATTYEDIDTLDKLCSNKKVVAIGEIGLDYHSDEPTRDIQKHWFNKQLELAEKNEKPVIIHSRDAEMDTLEIIKNSKVRNGVIHCFSSSKEIAKEYLDLGFFIGVGGVVTFKNGRKLVEVVENTPLTRILLETDSPYLSPEPKRGERNDSRNLIYISEKIAQIKGISSEEVQKVTAQNALKVFIR